MGKTFDDDNQSLFGNTFCGSNSAISEPISSICVTISMSYKNVKDSDNAMVLQMLGNTVMVGAFVIKCVNIMVTKSVKNILP